MLCINLRHSFEYRRVDCTYMEFFPRILGFYDIMQKYRKWNKWQINFSQTHVTMLILMTLNYTKFFVIIGFTYIHIIFNDYKNINTLYLIDESLMLMNSINNIYVLTPSYYRFYFHIMYFFSFSKMSLKQKMWQENPTDILEGT